MFCTAAAPAVTGMAGGGGGGPCRAPIRLCPVNFHAAAPAAARTTTPTRTFLRFTRSFSCGQGAPQLNTHMRSKVPPPARNPLFRLHFAAMDEGEAAEQESAGPRPQPLRPRSPSTRRHGRRQIADGGGRRNLTLA